MFKMFLPQKSRMIKHFCSFSYSLLRQNRSSQLLSCFTKNEGRSLRHQRSYILPKANTNLGKYSFRMQMAKLFNFCTFSLALNKKQDAFYSFFSNNIFLFYDFCIFFWLILFKPLFSGLAWYVFTLILVSTWLQ